jgi:hypothetical protein
LYRSHDLSREVNLAANRDGRWQNAAIARAIAAMTA